MRKEESLLIEACEHLMKAIKVLQTQVAGLRHENEQLKQELETK